MRLELRHLQMVCSIADYGSLTKAASALGLAPSALTTQLQRIERSLGGPLFERDRRGARPTPLGDLVLSRARTLLPAVKDLHDEAIRLTGTGGSAQFYRIGAVSSPILGGVIRRLNAADPSVHVMVQPSSSPAELADRLAARRIDVALIGLCGSAPPPGKPELTWHDVAVDAVCVLLPANHPLAGSGEVDLAEFATATWAAGGPYECCFDDCFAAACARAGFTVRRMYEVDVRTAIELVEAGEVVALCQSSFRPPDGLVAVPLAGTPLRWRHVVGWVPGAVGVKAITQLLEFAARSYEDALARAGCKTRSPTTPSAGAAVAISP